MTPRRFAGPPRRCSCGFSLIELLVAVTVGLVVTLAVSTLLIRSEGAKRSIASLNDTNQTGAYVAYLLDRMVRSAGSGFAQTRASSFGCLLAASRAGTVLLPRPSGNNLPAPFVDVSTQPVRLAPVVITKNASAAGSDVLTVMTGAGGRAEAQVRITSAETNDTLVLPTTLNLRANDLLLLTAGTGPCMVQQVASNFSNAGSLDVQVGLGGDFHPQTVGTVSVTDYNAGTASMLVLGNTAASRPQLSLIGVGADRTLFGYDLLQVDGATAAVPLADGIVALRALYGVDANDDGVLDTWVDPVATSGYDAATLMNGTPTSLTKLNRIVAVRLGLVLRTSLLERNNVAASSVTLFADLGAGLQTTQSIATADQRFRHRTVELTVPVRNLLN